MDQHDPSSSFSDPLTPPSFQPSTERAPVTFYDNVPLVGPGLNPQFYNPTGPRSRTRTTDSQLKVLLEVYAQDRRPTNARKREIADQIGMTVKQVQVCFHFPFSFLYKHSVVLIFFGHDCQVWFQNRCVFLSSLHHHFGHGSK